MIKRGVKERIIDAASDLFYNKGYNQTGINLIIAEAGVAKASMYQHFRSKEDIAVAYLKQRHINWMDNLQNFVSNKETNKEKVIASFDCLDSWLSSVNYRGCGFQNILCDLPQNQQKIEDQVVLHKTDLKKWIDSLLSDDANQRDLGKEILVLLEGAIILSQIQKNSWPIKAAKSAAIKLLS